MIHLFLWLLAVATGHPWIGMAIVLHVVMIYW
jgi:hypothetical protein